ncbi:MAG: hypothetical protein JKY80_01555 [Mariprofundaceae bacterium]|nr:hypothetical protein [Mariprofundaceae bacterium]
MPSDKRSRVTISEGLLDDVLLIFGSIHRKSLSSYALVFLKELIMSNTESAYPNAKWRRIEAGGVSCLRAAAAGVVFISSYEC